MLLLQIGLGFDADGVRAEDSRSRTTAIALNYCRASFHRIRSNPTKPVLVEEQDKILNNLNLNGIADEVVLKLYASVLDEIAQTQIAERERDTIRQHHKRIFRHQAFQNAFVAGSQALSGQFGNAIRTGAGSWWDYRSMVWQRGVDLWKIDKLRLNAINQQSTLCLDAFWKMSRSKNIPDRWLVRDGDLDRLEAAVLERDLEVRLRVLKRMQPFMECYPPYWYYLARTQQAKGQLFAAAETYNHLADLGTGFFRQDDMLAAGLANRAAIQLHLGQPSAAKTAREALVYSSTVWQANLMCAFVLADHKHFAEAKDAILRNIDVDLEQDHSTVALWELFRISKNSEARLKLLEDHEMLGRLPIPILLAGLSGLGDVPDAVRDHLRASIGCRPKLRFGRDDVLITASTAWSLARAQVTLTIDGREYSRPTVQSGNGLDEVRFSQVIDTGSLLGRDRELEHVEVAVGYAKDVVIRLTLDRQPADSKVNGQQVSRSKSASTTWPTVVSSRDQLELTGITWKGGAVQLTNRETPSSEPRRFQAVDADRIPRQSGEPATAPAAAGQSSEPKRQSEKPAIGVQLLPPIPVDADP
ncbi:MAG: hypothetical protein O3A00_18880 [Planctomycetota bacterium]|nr:hypothetical protein [Planctomycetota bacterium]